MWFRLDRSTQLALIVSALLLAETGCGGGGGAGDGGAGDDPVPSSNPPTAALQSPPLIGIGNVNHWAEPGFDCEAMARDLPPINLTGFEYTVPDGSVHPDILRVCIEAMRHQGVVSLITAANWAHDNPHTTSRSEAENEAVINQIADLIGTELVILIPVSEPSEKYREKAGQMTRYARSRWTGLMALSDFEEFGVKADFVDHHWCNPDRLEHALDEHLPLILNNTDCRPILVPDSPSQIYDWTRRALGKVNNLFFYDFYGTQPNQMAIDTIKAAITDWSATGGAT